MQAGLLDTYRRPLLTRGALAWALSAALAAFYLVLYFTEALTPLARAAGFGDKWTLYGFLYTVAMVAGGVYFLRRHGNSRYERVRTIVVVAVQVVLAFALPVVMKVFGAREYYFSYFWPLKIEYLYPSVILAHPFLIVAWSFLGSLVVFPVLAYYLGKRYYCSWVCGCGGLANTAGEPFRHLSDKSEGAFRVEQISIYAVLALAIAATLVVWSNWAVGPAHPRFAAFAFGVQRWYGLAIGALFAGVLGVGLYPLMGTRVWCRFGCPMAAMLGLIQKVGRFRITVKKDMCIACGNCSTYCEMGIDVRRYAMANEDVRRAACVGCGLCAHVCPRGVLRLENAPARGKAHPALRLHVGSGRGGGPHT
ncbi:MAG TPA: 4Fe-4S dicluster-binding protein [Vicinamibacteria bacterium]|nr:4Fe-4S dicluster-binding protein [Vicinamibacteria bacterium]